MRVQIVQMSGATVTGEIEQKSLAEVFETVKGGWLVVKEPVNEVLVKVDNILYIRRSL
jgi:hypothetical protein